MRGHLVNDGRGRRILFVCQGAPGGIGRAERLFESAWTAAAADEPVVVESLRKMDYPAYLGGGSTAKSGAGRAALGFALRVLWRWFRWRPHLVVLGHANFAPLAIVMRALRRGQKVVVLAYGIDVWTRPGYWVRSGLQLATSLWCISEFTRRQLVAVAGVPDSRCRVVPLAVGVPAVGGGGAREEANGPSRSSGSDAVLLSVTRLDPADRYKGVDHVIRALPSITAAVGGVTYVIVGEGADRMHLEEVARKVGVADRVVFAGSVDDAELARTYRRSSVFVLPSEREGFGLACIEAMAAGLPVVAARAGATTEVVRDGETGILVEYADVPGLAEALIDLLMDASRRVAMGRAGAARVAERYTVETFVSRVRELLWELLDPADCRPAHRAATPVGG